MNGFRVLFCASEVAPFEKTGGLADVTGSLPLALGRLGAEVLVTMPRYRDIPKRQEELAENVHVCFIEHEEYFNRAGLYGNERGDYADNLDRFSFFCGESLALARKLDFRPDIVHAHDWQTALLPVLLKTKEGSNPFFSGSKSLLTIHNVAYQGLFPGRQFGSLGLDPSLFSVDGFEFHGKINLLKGGCLFADALTTVSPTYAQEIRTREFGFGLEGVLKKREGALSGILNGLDTQLWDPSADGRIAKKYSPSGLSGKKICKLDLQKSCGLETDPDIPLFAMVTRLAEQKGLDLVTEIADAWLSGPVQFVLLGDGDSVYRTAFQNIGKRHPKKTAIFLGFDAFRAHAVYAGCDFFLMPSYFEPCGLGQMIAMRYGALPIVRKVGGLADTVTDLEEDAARGNGFVFKEPVPETLLKTVRRAMRLFKNKTKLSELQKRVMKIDFSWDRSAGEYWSLYEDLLS